MVKDWLVVDTVRLTVVVSLAPPLVPVIVTVCGPGGIAILAAVAIVIIIDEGEEPLTGTLPEFAKLQLAPLGRPLQLAGVKLTVPVKPLAGVMVIWVVTGFPTGMLRVAGVADSVYGMVTVTVAELEETELPCVALPLYVAVTTSVPAGNAVVANVAVPSETAARPKEVDPLLKKLTFPVAVEGLTVAVKVTLLP
jgi:hypothetical protein